MFSKTTFDDFLFFSTHAKTLLVFANAKPVCRFGNQPFMPLIDDSDEKGYLIIWTPHIDCIMSVVEKEMCVGTARFWICHNPRRGIRSELVNYATSDRAITFATEFFDKFVL